MQFFDANLESLKKNNVFLYEQLEVYINSKYDYKEDLKYKKREEIYKKILENNTI